MGIRKRPPVSEAFNEKKQCVCGPLPKTNSLKAFSAGIRGVFDDLFFVAFAQISPVLLTDQVPRRLCPFGWSRVFSTHTMQYFGTQKVGLIDYDFEFCHRFSSDGRR